MLDFLKAEIVATSITIISYIAILAIFCGAVYLLSKVFIVYAALAIVSAGTIAFVTMFWSALNSNEVPTNDEV